jgi:hypothetical protein
MLHVHLAEDECAMLRHLLELKLRDLQHEIHHTDSREFKTGLRHEEELIRGLRERLGAGVPAAAR